MKNRTLGRSGIEVSPIGMGCWIIDGIWQFLDIQAGQMGQIDEILGRNS